MAVKLTISYINVLICMAVFVYMLITCNALQLGISAQLEQQSQVSGGVFQYCLVQRGQTGTLPCVRLVTTHFG